MKNKEYRIFSTEEYDEWLEGEPARSQVQVRDRVSLIREEGHFGDRKDLENGIWELRWRNGRRVYYALIPEKKVLLLLGGNKNGQSKDIRQAKKILSENVTFEE
jgi:putative addiction module killer protein